MLLCASLPQTHYDEGQTASLSRILVSWSYLVLLSLTDTVQVKGSNKVMFKCFSYMYLFCACVWRNQRTTCGSQFLRHTGPGAGTQVIRFDSKHLHPLSHLTSLQNNLLFLGFSFIFNSLSVHGYVQGSAGPLRGQVHWILPRSSQELKLQAFVSRPR